MITFNREPGGLWWSGPRGQAREPVGQVEGDHSFMTISPFLLM